MWNLWHDTSFDQLRNIPAILKYVVFVTTCPGLPYNQRLLFAGAREVPAEHSVRRRDQTLDKLPPRRAGSFGRGRRERLPYRLAPRPPETGARLGHHRLPAPSVRRGRVPDAVAADVRLVHQRRRLQEHRRRGSEAGLSGRQLLGRVRPRHRRRLRLRRLAAPVCVPVGRGEADQVDAAAGGRDARARVRAAVRRAQGPQRQLRGTEDQRQSGICGSRLRQLAQCPARRAASE